LLVVAEQARCLQHEAAAGELTEHIESERAAIELAGAHLSDHVLLIARGATPVHPELDALVGEAGQALVIEFLLRRELRRARRDHRDLQDDRRVGGGAASHVGSEQQAQRQTQQRQARER
jgi:hypothetical protein